jgi:thiol:disulfide interchange protein DsbD
MKALIITILSFSVTISAFSQTPVNWSYTAKKVADKTYESHLSTTVQMPWHIYSQTSPEGGALPTKIVFNKNPLAKPDGKTKEIGKIVSKYVEVFGVTVKYFDGKADFVQVITLRQAQGDKPIKTKISGSIEFMACNDEQCLPPQTVKFNVKLE